MHLSISDILGGGGYSCELTSPCEAHCYARQPRAKRDFRIVLCHCSYLAVISYVLPNLSHTPLVDTRLHFVWFFLEFNGPDHCEHMIAHPLTIDQDLILGITTCKDPTGTYFRQYRVSATFNCLVNGVHTLRLWDWSSACCWIYHGVHLRARKTIMRIPL